MSTANIAQQNWVGGELSPKMRGRFDLPIYASGAERIVNFISETSGPATYRTGTVYVNNTRRNHVACLIPFQFNDSQSYLLEFTEGYIRFFRNNGILVSSEVTITGATQASPIVITSIAHGLSDGDEVIISGVSGMTELNNRSFVIAGTTANTFQLRDNFGNNTDSTFFGSYVSGGTAQKIYEVESPYREEDLFELKTAQNADTMYIVHHNYEPRKLTRLGLSSWSLALFTRTADPFLDKKTITGITQANPAVVTSVAHGYTDGDYVIIETVVGMTDVNGGTFIVKGAAADTFQLTDLDGNNIDSSAYGAYVSGGYASDQDLLPAAVCFYQGRLLYGCSDSYPESFWGSKALDTNGDPQYDNFTLGTNPADAFKFTLSPSTGKVDKIEALVPTTSFLAICTFEGVSKADGGTSGAAITPSNINVVPAVTEGVSHLITPILRGSSMVLIHRSGLTMYSFEYDVFSNAYNAIDKNLANEHINKSGIKQMIFQNGRPPSFWLIRNDGVLTGITYLAKENINGGHRHLAGGNSASFISVGNMPRDNAYDQLWVVSERAIDGETARYVEYFSDVPQIPEPDDYYTDDEAQTSDDEDYRHMLFEAQKEAIHLDASLTYDGSDQDVGVMPNAATGSSIAFYATGAVFNSSMVGREIWKKTITGSERGRATITAYVSPTEVTCEITVEFDTVATIAAGNWFLTTGSISGLWHLEGETVEVVVDGGEHTSEVVTSGAITLDSQYSKVHVGFGYIGFLKSMNVEAAGVNGVARSKPKNINRLGISFLNTLGARYGTSLYNMESVEFRDASDYLGMPPPLFSGEKRLFLEDDTDEEKHVYIQQIKPLPCTVLCIIPYVDTDND